MSDSGLWVNGAHAASNEADMLIVSNADYFSFGGAQLRDSNGTGLRRGIICHQGFCAESER
jgi:hypothetical protein